MKATASQRRVRTIAAWSLSVFLVVGSLVGTFVYVRDSQIPATADGTGMVWIRAGKYVVGALTPEPGDLKARWIQLPGFAIDREPVIDGALATFVQLRPETIGASAWSQHRGVAPQAAANGVPYPLAEAYCASRHGHIPTEIQWDIAARGGDGRVYPWGNQPWVPASRDLSPFGVQHTVTQLSEWVSEPLHPIAATDAVVRGRVSPRMRVATVNQRRTLHIDDAASRTFVGFRCAANNIRTRSK